MDDSPSPGRLRRLVKAVTSGGPLGIVGLTVVVALVAVVRGTDVWTILAITGLMLAVALLLVVVGWLERRTQPPAPVAGPAPDDAPGDGADTTTASGG